MSSSKYSQVRQTLLQKTSSMKATSLAKRQESIFKKAKELSSVCGNEVCVIYYGSQGELKTWPEDREKVKDMALRYSQLSDVKRRKRQADLDQVLKKIINNDDHSKKKVNVGSSYKYPDWDPRFDSFSVEQITELIQSLECSQTILQHRLHGVVESQRQRNMQYTNMTGEEQMNHLRQHEYGSYSSLLGTQETGMNEAMSTNMLPYNSIYTNCVNFFKDLFHQNCYKLKDCFGFLGRQGTGINKMNMEDYSELLGTQGTGINGLKNMNNNNTNGLSHQFVQYPAQGAPPFFQCMDRSL